METLLGFRVGFWDYVTFAAIAFLVLAGLGLAVFVLGLPGRIAIARNHPEADAVNLMGWVGFVAIVPWVQALISNSAFSRSRRSPNANKRSRATSASWRRSRSCRRASSL